MSLSKSLYLILSQYLIFSKISLYLMSLSFSCISVFHVFQDIMYHNISRSHVFQQILYLIQSCIFSTSVISVSHVPHVYNYTMYTIYLCVTWIYISHDLMIPLSHVYIYRSISHISLSHSILCISCISISYVSQYLINLSILCTYLSFSYISLSYVSHQYLLYLCIWYMLRAWIFFFALIWLLFDVSSVLCI